MAPPGGLAPPVFGVTGQVPPVFGVTGQVLSPGQPDQPRRLRSSVRAAAALVAPPGGLLQLETALIHLLMEL